MSLTRKWCKSIGLTDEQTDAVIEEHVSTIDPLKAKADKYEESAEQLDAAKKQIAELTEANASIDRYKQKYEDEHKAFESYKNDVSSKETKAAKEKAVRAYYKSKNIDGDNLDIAIRGSTAEIAGIELEDGKIKDTSALDALVNGTYKGLVTHTQTQGTNPATPPANTGAIGKKDLYKRDEHGRYVMSTAERQKAIAETLTAE